MKLEAYTPDETNFYASNAKAPDGQINSYFPKGQGANIQVPGALFDMHKHVLHVLSLQQVLIGLRSHGVDHETTGNINLDVLDYPQGRYGVGSKHGLVRRMVHERGDQGVVIIKPPLQPNVSRKITARRRRRIRSCRGCGVRQSAGAVDDDMHV